MLSKEQWSEAALRSLLVELLAQTLEIDGSEIDTAKTFDECGLDSIAAVIATGPLGERLGVELPAEFLFRNNSIDEVIRALLGEGPTDAQPAGFAPIFMFPGGGGRDGPHLIRFRAQCASDLAFEVISIGSWRDWIEHDLDFDSLARRARQQIENIAADGPLRISASSQGGQLAFATALALSQAGRRIEFVGLLDASLDGASLGGASRAAGSGPKWRTGASGGVWRIGRQSFFEMLGQKNSRRDGSMRVRAFRGLWLRCRGPLERRRLLRLVARFGRALFQGPGGVRLDLAIQIALFQSMSNAWFEQKRLTARLDWPVFLFRSDDPGDPDLGWGSVCSNLKMVPVGGDHHSMFDPEHLNGLVTQFEAAFRQTNSVASRTGAAA
jgi:thioesterase domain-containing protein/acyl carrier protein